MPIFASDWIKILKRELGRLINIRLYLSVVVQTSLLLGLTLGLAGLLVFGTFGLVYAQTIETVNVVENKLVTLIGVGFDPDDDDLTYFWEQLDGEPMELSSNMVENPQFMAPEVANGMGPLHQCS